MTKQILCVSTSNFYPTPTRKQNVMTRLQDAEILYIDPPVSLIAPLKDPSAWKRLFAFRKKPRPVTDAIWVWAPPPVLPFFNRFRWINRINQRILAGYLARRIKEKGFQTPYLWCYSPTSCDLVDHIPTKGVIYDCVDRHSAYPGMINPLVVDQMEEDLARKALQVFCTAEGLYQRLSPFNEKTALIPNGAAYALFSQAADLEGTSRKSTLDRSPVFGFVGMLQECIAYDYLEALAEARGDAEIRIIGKALPGVDLSRLKAFDNVTFLGLLPQEELPEQIRSFDVCLNVFQDGDLAKDVSPLKFYEYLATGKPIVSTKMPLQVLSYADVVYIAGSPEEFVVQCDLALKERDAEKVSKRMEYGRACSWEERVRQMEELLPQEWRSE